MPLTTQFRTVGNFEAESPLDRQIQQFEDNAGAAFGALASKSMGKLAPTSRKVADYPAKLGELVIATNGIDVMLPKATAQNAGETIGIVVESGTVTTFSAESDVQGGTTDSITAGAWFYISTGVGWWRAG